MDTTEVVEAPAAPVVETPTESLADHEATYGNGRKGTEPVESDDPDAAAVDRDTQGRFRHRAASQKASPDEVSKINELTKTLRAKEAELAKTRPDALAGSPRIRSLERQIKALESELAPAETKPAQPAIVPPKAPAPFTAKAPAIDDFKDAEDPYEATILAKAEYQRKKEAFDAAQESAKREQAEQHQRTLDAHKASVTTFKAAHPDWDTVMANNTAKNISPVMGQALLHSGADLMYHLAKQPGLSDELFLQTGAIAPDHPHFWDFVASTQRRLIEHAQAASTGSAAAARPTYTPPASPPNPVRTGPIRTGDDLPSDDSSLAEHERAYGAKKRR